MDKDLLGNIPLFAKLKDEELVELAALLKDFAEHGVNIDLLYMASKSRLVIGTEMMHEAREGVRTIEATFG